MIKLYSIARKQTGGSVMEELFAVDISVGEGLDGDYKDEGDAGMVSILSRDSWIKVCEEAGTELSWLAREANLLIRGFEFLPTDVGKSLRVGEVILEVIGETRPCESLEDSAPGLHEALMTGWRGGVNCKVIRGGSIQSGDEIDIID